MSDKIEELVEWVALRIKGNDQILVNSFVNNNESVQMEACKLIARSILNHPDLALIDREKLVTNLKLIATGTFKKKGDYPSIVECIIPLAETLKERLNE